MKFYLGALLMLFSSNAFAYSYYRCHLSHTTGETTTRKDFVLEGDWGPRTKVEKLNGASLTAIISSTIVTSTKLEIEYNGLKVVSNSAMGSKLESWDQEGKLLLVLQDGSTFEASCTPKFNYRP